MDNILIMCIFAIVGFLMSCAGTTFIKFGISRKIALPFIVGFLYLTLPVVFLFGEYQCYKLGIITAGLQHIYVMGISYVGGIVFAIILHKKLINPLL